MLHDADMVVFIIHDCNDWTAVVWRELFVAISRVLSNYKEGRPIQNRQLLLVHLRRIATTGRNVLAEIGQWSHHCRYVVDGRAGRCDHVLRQFGGLFDISENGNSGEHRARAGQQQEWLHLGHPGEHIHGKVSARNGYREVYAPEWERRRSRASDARGRRARSSGKTRIHRLEIKLAAYHAKALSRIRPLRLQFEYVNIRRGWSRRRFHLINFVLQVTSNLSMRKSHWWYRPTVPTWPFSMTRSIACSKWDSYRSGWASICRRRIGARITVDQSK